MYKLSARQHRILAFIGQYRSAHGFAPSIRDIQQACSVSSTSVVDYNLRILQRENYVTRSPEISRGIRLIDAEADQTDFSYAVPLLGYIAAGTPIPIPSEDIWQQGSVERVNIPIEMGKDFSKDVFALQVRGFSMIDALIDDGDLIVLRQGVEVRDGDMVAAWLRIEQEATLKRLYREGAMIRLQPANVQMEPIIVPAKNVEVHGKVIAVIRRLS